MDLCHHRSGSGPPVLLLHGIGLTSIVWRPVLPMLEREREVIALDLPGFGASPAGPVTIEGLAHAVAAFAAQLGLARPHVAGNSLGGGIALAMGAAGRAATVCALSPVGFGSGGKSRYTHAVLRASRLGARALAPLAGPLTARPVSRAALFAHAAMHPSRIPPAEAAETTRAFAAAPAFERVLEASDWTPAVPACPTTVAWAQRDAVLPRTTHARRARRALPDARHLVLRGCGHVPMWDDPEQVARVILEASAAG